MDRRPAGWSVAPGAWRAGRLAPANVRASRPAPAAMVLPGAADGFRPSAPVRSCRRSCTVWLCERQPGLLAADRIGALCVPDQAHIPSARDARERCGSSRRTTAPDQRPRRLLLSAPPEAPRPPERPLQPRRPRHPNGAKRTNWSSGRPLDEESARSPVRKTQASVGLPSERRCEREPGVERSCEREPSEVFLAREMAALVRPADTVQALRRLPIPRWQAQAVRGREGRPDPDQTDRQRFRRLRAHWAVAVPAWEPEASAKGWEEQQRLVGWAGRLAWVPRRV